MPAVIPAMNVRAHQSHGLAVFFVSFTVVSATLADDRSVLSACELRACSLRS